MIKQTLEFERSTKGTHVYQQQGDDPAAVRTLYVAKHALKSAPKLITITIVEGEEANPHEFA